MQCQEEKEDFIKLMDALSYDIKEYLGEFEELPYKSYPYYVSQEAYMYAFNVPRTNRLVVVDFKDGKPYFAKYRATRYVYAMKHEGGVGEFSDKDMRYEHLLDRTEDYDGGRYFMLDDSQSVIDFLIYIENIEYFVILSKSVSKKISNILYLSFEDKTKKEDMFLIDGYALDLSNEYRRGDEYDHTHILYKYDSKILVWLRNHKPLSLSPRERLKNYKKHLAEVRGDGDL